MVKHTQIIRRVLPTNCSIAFDHFVGLALRGLKSESPKTKSAKFSQSPECRRERKQTISLINYLSLLTLITDLPVWIAIRVSSFISSLVQNIS